MKKFLVSFLIFGMFLTFSPVSVKAATVTDLYVQLQTLQKQIVNLQSQMSALALRAEVPTVSVVNQAPLTVVDSNTSKDIVPVKTITPTSQTVTVPSQNVLPVNTEKIINTATKMGISSKGADVLALQKILIKKGLLKKELATGYYGTATAAAVSNFQKANGLTEDGVAGKGTIAKLISLTENLTTNPCLVDINGNYSTTPSTTVLSPNGGETFTPGQKITVKWNTCKLINGDKVGIFLHYVPNNFLYNLSGIVGTPTAFILNDGSEELILPSTSSFGGMNVTWGKNFKIYITPQNSSYTVPVYDQSDNLFTINNTATALNIDSHIASTSFISSTSTKTENPGIKNDLGNFSMTFNVAAADGDIYLPKVVSFSTLVNGIFLNINTPSGGLETSGVNGVITCITNCATSSSGNNFVVQDGNTATFKVSAIVDNSSTMHGQAFYRLSLAAIPWNINDSGTFHLYAPVNVQNYVTQSIYLD